MNAKAIIEIIAELITPIFVGVLSFVFKVIRSNSKIYYTIITNDATEITKKPINSFKYKIEVIEEKYENNTDTIKHNERRTEYNIDKIDEGLTEGLEFTQFFLWNKGMKPLKRSDFRVKLEDNDIIEKKPVLDFGVSIYNTSYYIDNSSFFKLIIYNNDSKLVFDFKDEILYGNGFVINVLHQKLLSNNTPVLSMPLHNNKIKQIKPLEKFWFVLYLIVLPLCEGMLSYYVYSERYIFATLYFISSIIGIYGIFSAWKLCLFSMPKYLKSKKYIKRQQ